MSPRPSRARKLTVPRSSRTVLRTTGRSFARRRTLAGVSPAARRPRTHSLRADGVRFPARSASAAGHAAHDAKADPAEVVLGEGAGREISRSAEDAAARDPRVRPFAAGVDAGEDARARGLLPLALVGEPVRAARALREPP